MKDFPLSTTGLQNCPHWQMWFCLLTYMYTQTGKKKEKITSPAHFTALTLRAWEGEHLLISQSLCWFLHSEHPPASKKSCPFLSWLDLETVDENWLVAQFYPWTGSQHCFRRSKRVFCRPILCFLKLSDLFIFNVLPLLCWRALSWEILGETKDPVTVLQKPGWCVLGLALFSVLKAKNLERGKRKKSRGSCIFIKLISSTHYIVNLGCHFYQRRQSGCWVCAQGSWSHHTAEEQ